jgi:hypothetical protein
MNLIENVSFLTLIKIIVLPTGHQRNNSLNLIT